MKTKEIANKYSIDVDDFDSFLSRNKLDYKEGFSSRIVDDSKVLEYVLMYKAEQKQKEEDANAAKQAEIDKQKAISQILISSGFNFDGYRIVKYSGYISGDDVIQIAKEKSFWIGRNLTDVGEALSKSLVKIRRQALAELKEAAYDLGCNAVIGVDFDYITLDPQVHNGQFTQDLPYVFCVTANGNAVVIEKESD